MTIKNNSFLYIFILVLAGCGNNDPRKEDVPELITKVTLTFTPTSGSPIVVTATDPDGEGVQNIRTDGTLQLSKSTTYTLTIQLINGLAAPTDSEYDVTHEVESEGVEHMFFFGWTGNSFTDPSGDGNIDVRTDKVNYTGGSNSLDKTGLPLGLTTTWTTTDITTESATLRVLLKHQPGLKSGVSVSTDGETDLDVTFPLTVE